MIYGGFLDWEPVAGYPIKNFDWILALYILGIAIAVCVIFYFLFVYIFTKKKMSASEEEAADIKIKDIKKLKKDEKKAAIKALNGPEKRLRGWRLVKVPVIAVLAFGVAVSCVAAPVLSSSWEALLQALHKKTRGIDDSESARLAIGESKENIVTLEEEGIVLLKNDDNVLPLNIQQNNKINVFGASAFGLLYGGGGSGVFVTNATVNGNDFHATRLETALNEEGFEYNQNLYNLVANYYESRSYKITETKYDISCQYNIYPGNTYDRNGNRIIDDTKFPYDNEPETSAYNKTYDGLNGKTLLEAAKEYSDTALFAISRSGSEDSDLNHSLCQLTSRESAMLTMLQENFDKVIFLINSSNPMEIGQVDQKGIDSVLWIGHPGLTGTRAVAKVLSGKVNPSGKTADTWAYDITTAPSFQSFGPDTTLYSSPLGKYIVEYREGIYVGYRYYTTRAFTDPTFKYEDYVQYSFGQGMSYTTFEKYINDYEVDLEHNKVSVQVCVKNTGKVAGKEVVELYLTAPYTDGGIEKAYVELAGFAKTELIEPNGEFYARIDIDLESMASWDFRNDNYVLEAGKYEISLRDDAWHLSEVPAGFDNTINFTYAENQVFTKGKGGAEYKAQFSEAEYGPHQDKIKYLSRADWTGTFPKTTEIKTSDITDTAKASVNNPTFTTDNLLDGDTTVDMPSGITLRDMRDASYDDPRWSDFLAQMSKADLVNLADNGGFQTAEIKSIQKRATYDDDGPASIQVKGTGYVGEVVIASSWNVEAARLFGKSIGKEGAAMGLTGWYAPGLNIHRCPTGGRNFEYYSEDPLISGKMAGYTAKGALEFGVYTYAKHIALNEQETQRQNLTVWANEQSIRQIYLKACQVYAEEDGLGFMSSFSRIGGAWSGAQGFLNNVCRDEWGWHGVVITDWVNPSLMPANAGLRAGNDLWLYKNTNSGCNDAVNRTPHDGIILLKRAAKNILYACAHSNATWTEAEYAEKGIEVDFSKMGVDNY